jgi:hypothetical protein
MFDLIAFAAENLTNLLLGDYVAWKKVSGAEKASLRVCLLPVGNRFRAFGVGAVSASELKFRVHTDPMVGEQDALA